VRLGWLTDIHLNFLRPGERAEFFTALQREKLDGVLLGGDIGEARSVCHYLSEMAEALSVPIYFVLGNHDFYGGSIAAVRNSVAQLAAQSQWLRWLPVTGVVPLTSGTALVGHDSWADGRLGDFFGSEVLLNDYIRISDLLCSTKAERYSKLNALGDEAADHLERGVREAIDRFQNVIVLTHVPPFREACWHEGGTSSDEFLPHFACRAVGEQLLEIMRDRPDRAMAVLCGHTHSPGFAQILNNLVVRTGGAQYGSPALQQILELV